MAQAEVPVAIGVDFPVVAEVEVSEASAEVVLVVVVPVEAGKPLKRNSGLDQKKLTHQYQPVKFKSKYKEARLQVICWRAFT